MAIDWQSYDNFGWASARQDPMKEAERATVADLVADLLGLREEDCRQVWGFASSPGRYAATVIRVRAGIRHHYQERAAASQIGEVGVKVFKTGAVTSSGIGPSRTRPQSVH